MKHAAACTRLASLLLPLLALLASRGASGQKSAAAPGRYNFTVHENRPAGFQVGQVKLNPGFAYQLSPASPLFSFDSATGIITTKVSIDRETLISDTVDLLIIGSSTSSVVSLSVRIHILDENDNSPRFPEPLVTWEISENAIVGSARILPIASDPDVGANSVTLNYKITSGNVEGKFHLRVENSLGFLQLKLLTVGRLDREKASSYSLNISAEDGGHPIRHGYLAVQVTVEDYNDERPKFEQQVYQAVVNETVSVGQEIARVRATDADQAGTVNALVTYRFKEIPFKNEFEVDARTGAVRVAKPLTCFRSIEGCALSIEATDNGMPQLHSENFCTVQITVLRSNDHSPEVRVILSTKKDDYAVIDETSKPDDPIGVVQVTDADSGKNGQTSLALLQTSGYFALRPLSANYYRIVTARTFTTDSPKDFQLLLRAEDKGQPPRISTLTVTVRVNKANQFAPSFNESLKVVHLSQLAPVGSFVASMIAHDNDSHGINSEVRYQIVDGNDGDYFRIAHDSGLVLTKKLLKLVKQSAFHLNISASDSGPKRLISYAMLQVQVERGNHAPSCRTDRLEFQVQKGNAFRSLLDEVCQDSDIDSNGALTFSVQRQTTSSIVNRCRVVAGQFNCDSIQEDAKYVIDVFDQAQIPLNNRLHLNIRVVRNETRDLQFYPLRYHVTTPAGETDFGKVLTQLRASGSGALHYSLQSLRPDFLIDSNNGVVRMANYTAEDVAKLIFLVNDEHGNVAKNPATVRVYPVPTTTTGRPVFLQTQYSFELIENSGAAASSSEARNLGFVSAADVYGYEIVDGDPNGIFSVSSSGAISVVKYLDREQNSNFNLTVVGLGSSDVCTCHVSIKVTDQNDNTPVFEWTEYEFNISDSTPIGHTLGVIKAQDSDEGMNSKLTYALRGRQTAYFELDKDSGLLKLSYSVSKWLDEELQQGISLSVTVSDTGRPARSSSVEVRVTIDPSFDDYPMLNESNNEFFVSENAAVNSIVGKVNATGKYSIIYSLSPLFSTDLLEDEISILPTGELYISRALDREARDSYEIEVYATFFEPSMQTQPEWRTSSTTVTVYVQDVNDCSPIFSLSNYVFELPENSTADHLVGRVFAADADEGANGHILYYLADVPRQGLFHIDPVLGEIRSMRQFDFENPGDREFEFAVIAKDSGSDKDAVQSGHARVKILITDVNDHRPAFTASAFRFEIHENATEGSIVAQLSANDPDSGLNGAMVFSFLKGNELGNFALGENTGELRVNKLLDREQNERFELLVSVSDKGGPKLSTSVLVFVLVLDCNDQKPVFNNAQIDYVSVSEDVRPGTRLHKFFATDRDAENNSKFFFSIAFGNIDEVFGMDQVTGTLYLAKPLDYESRSRYHLAIRATDFGGQFSQINFTVRVENVNDNAPQFAGSPLVIQVEENLSGGTIGRVVARDADGDEISYHLVFQEPYGTDFRVDSQTGAIVVEKALDRERVAVYKLHIEARDRPAKVAEKRLTSAVTITTVIVDDVDDNKAVLHTQVGLLLPLTLTPGAKVARLIASDADQGENAKIVFAISGPDAAYFAVDRHTSELTLLAQPVETKTFFDLLVKVNKEDSGQPVRLIVPSRENNGPVFSQSSYTGEVAEGTEAGREILRMRALYAGNPRSAVQYLITGVYAGNRSEPQPRGLFHLENSADYGVLQTGPLPLDREATRTGQYQLEVTALDTGSRLPRTRTASIYIVVQDVNDSPPAVSASTLEVQLPDEEDVNPDASWPIPLAQAAASDPDDEDSPLKWRTVGDSWPEVAVQERTGLLTLVSRPPPDAIQSRPQLQLEVSDSLRHVDRVLVRFLPSSQRLRRRPTFQTMSTIIFNVTEAAPPGSLVGHLATAATASYRLLMPTAVPFDLDARWGILRTSGRLDYETRTHYLLVAVATDAESGLTSTTELAVNVLDENDNAPVCRLAIFEATVVAPGRVGEVLLTVQAEDAGELPPFHLEVRDKFYSEARNVTVAKATV